MRRLLAGLLFTAFLGVACGDGGDTGPTTTPGVAGPLVTISQSGREARVRVEFAATLADRQSGLMFRKEMDEDAGMLFIFPRDSQVGFWMKNTEIPLDIAYISAEGIVMEVRQATPFDETALVPSRPYRYVLEVNQGWFERHGLGAGAAVTLPANVPTATE